MSATAVATTDGQRQDRYSPVRAGVPGGGAHRAAQARQRDEWPERETVTDDSQGVPLATIQELARYWGTDYDWSKCEAKLNAVPISSPRSTGSTFISSTFARSTRARCR